MKNQVTNQTEIETAQFTKVFTLKRALVAEIEYDNGTTGESVTFINNDTDEELIVSGIREGLKRQHNVSAVKFTVCSFVDGILKPYMFYGKDTFTTDEKIEATNGGYVYYLKRKHADELNNFMKENNISHNHKSNYAYAV
jgi:hypothetical protein